MVMLGSVIAGTQGGSDGRATRDEILIGMHFIDRSNGNGSEPSGHPIDVTACFEDYLAHMEALIQAARGTG